MDDLYAHIHAHPQTPFVTRRRLSSAKGPTWCTGQLHCCCIDTTFAISMRRRFDGLLHLLHFQSVVAPSFHPHRFFRPEEWRMGELNDGFSHLSPPTWHHVKSLIPREGIVSGWTFYWFAWAGLCLILIKVQWSCPATIKSAHVYGKKTSSTNRRDQFLMCVCIVNSVSWIGMNEWLTTDIHVQKNVLGIILICIERNDKH